MQASATDHDVTCLCTPKRQLVTWTVVYLTTAKFLSLSCFLCRILIAQLHINLDDLCLFYALYCYVIVYAGRFEIRMQIAGRYAPVTISSSTVTSAADCLAWDYVQHSAVQYRICCWPTRGMPEKEDVRMTPCEQWFSTFVRPRSGKFFFL
jgi:hypothetical protein